MTITLGRILPLISKEGRFSLKKIKRRNALAIHSGQKKAQRVHRAIFHERMEKEGKAQMDVITASFTFKPLSFNAVSKEQHSRKKYALVLLVLEPHKLELMHGYNDM